MIHTSDFDEMIDHVVTGIFNDYPELLTRFGEHGRKKCREDIGHHFRTLEVAYEMKNTKVFLDYAEWLNGLLTSRGMTSEYY